MGGSVRHVCGDASELAGSADVVDGSFDAALSVLVVLHVPEERREPLFAGVREKLKPGGTFYIEDYVWSKAPEPWEERALEEKVACSWLPTREEYERCLAKAGLEIVEWDDSTGVWGAFTSERAAAFAAGAERNERVHGVELAADLQDFYDTVAKLFNTPGGALEGARIVCRRPH